MTPSKAPATALPELAPPVVFFTGAGISVSAGLPTYRGDGGLYSSGKLPPLSVADLSRARLPFLWEHYDSLGGPIMAARPTAGHLAIAALEDAFPGGVTVVTQNIDGLHAAAGSSNVFELHGNALLASCLGRAHKAPIASLERNAEGVPLCAVCSGRCRPDIVLFGERMSPPVWTAARAATARASTLVAVGTSAEVMPAALLLVPSESPASVRIWVNPAPPPSDLGVWTEFLEGSDSGLAKLAGLVPTVR